jgi:hypothetical protein
VKPENQQQEERGIVFHFIFPEIGHGMIALIALAGAAFACVMAIIFLLASWRVARESLRRSKSVRTATERHPVHRPAAPAPRKAGKAPIKAKPQASRAWEHDALEKLDF